MQVKRRPMTGFIAILIALLTILLWIVSYADQSITMTKIMAVAPSPDIAEGRPLPLPADQGEMRIFQFADLTEPSIAGETPAGDQAPANGRFLNKFVFDLGAQDTTEYKDVRTTAYKVGLGYQLTHSSILGVEAQKEFSDPGDAGAAGSRPDTDEGVHLKYRFRF